jgi:lysophospholipase L1-like esterase
MKDANGRRLDDFVVVNRTAANLAPRPVSQNTHALVRGAGTEHLSVVAPDTIGETSQTLQTVRFNASAFRFTYANIYNNAGVDAPGPSTITVKASVRMTGGLNFPVWFNGRRAVTIEPGAVVTSDPLGINIAKGATFFIQTHVSTTVGGQIPFGIKTRSGDSEGKAGGDQVGSGLTASASRCFSPIMVTAVPATPLDSPVILGLGDSNMAGYNDIVGTGDSNGVIRRAFDGVLSYVNVGVSSASVGTNDTLVELQYRMNVADTVQAHAALIIEGTNDIQGGASLATMQARYANLWALLAQRGLPIYQCTVPPWTTSSDSWATVGNQTVSAYEATRVLVNDWLRTVPSPVTHIFDLADAVESARNSGKWKAGYTIDGVHFGVNGATAAAAAIAPTIIGPVLP